ncbi:MAG: M48 family metalloprotease [Geminicoccaceae bacterium]|nr:M48 family metalloprotease [Geminicoccaceae bacterium]
MQRRHRWRNRLHSALLLGGMAALLAGCGWILFGAGGALWILVGSIAGFALGPQVSPAWLMRAYGARLLDRTAFPEGVALVEALAARAGLRRAPSLHYLPSRMLNAFAVGRGEDAAIAVTDGMLRTLDRRELTGVLAHEIAHVRNGDLWIMGVADAMSRLTGLLSYAGLLLALFALPLALLGMPLLPLAGGLLLIAAPTIGSLLQLALSRSREYDADLAAVELTGDPLGLASALGKLERLQGRYWEEILLPGRRMPQPSLLRTHPPSEQRIARLMALAGMERAGPALPRQPVAPRWPVVTAPPRFRRSGLWY